MAIIGVVYFFILRLTTKTLFSTRITRGHYKYRIFSGTNVAMV